MLSARICGVAASLALACSAASPAAAAEEKADDTASRYPLRWEPGWTHANAWDYSLTGVGLTVLLTETALYQQQTMAPRWVGPILFDDAVRDVMRLHSVADQGVAETASWVFWFTLVGYPLAVDVPYAWARYGRDVAWDLLWQSATALSLSSAVDLALRDSVARVRPKNTACFEQHPTDWNTCVTGPEVTRAFPSGHLSETTTGAALICTQHLTMHLYGPPWDAVTCASAVTADVGVAAVKMMADDHWASDILAGVGLGVAFGWGLPTLMHFRGHPADHATPPAAPALLVAPVPMAFERGGGLGVAAIF